ncbi:MAG: nickel pincer cofactor biosynthesis protein LarB [Thermomicrobiales bacterium]
MKRDPFSAIEAALAGADDDGDDLLVRVDHGRFDRTGVPEVVFADGKSDDQLVASCAGLLERAPRAVVSRIDCERAERIAQMIGDDLVVVARYPGRTVVLALRDSEPPVETGFVAILTAGTSDLAVAGEAATVAREIGCRVEIIADVGVAGLHRLVQPLRWIVRDRVDAIIVVAGMDGALPSVVSGLVDVPVIGLPTSVGYGVAAGGHTALMTMLSTCAPGMAVVNIDNGVGAGATAALIARRARQPRD